MDAVRICFYGPPDEKHSQLLKASGSYIAPSVFPKLSYTFGRAVGSPVASLTVLMVGLQDRTPPSALGEAARVAFKPLLRHRVDLRSAVATVEMEKGGKTVRVPHNIGSRWEPQSGCWIVDFALEKVVALDFEEDE